MAYVPTERVITDLEDMRRWVTDELKRLSQESAETTALELRPIAAAPTRPQEGMIVYADGTNWDPGDGAGSYEYTGGAWRRLNTRATSSRSWFGGAGQGATIAAGGSMYFGPPGSSAVSDTEVWVVMPFAGTIRDLFFATGGAPGVGETVTVTAMKNAVATALTASITGAVASTGSDVAHTVSFAQGDKLSMKASATGGAAAGSRQLMTFGFAIDTP